ncbi:hypothetical protein DNJ95_17840 [Stutzerimonas kirkiae]|nr:hypothetical protein DNJ95_17840 [Stutzerimonas kirkiae]TBV15429.1 hypothetical protein DNK01_07100 [Stutzerimonas kirkiae]
MQPNERRSPGHSHWRHKLAVKQLHGDLKPCSTHTGGYCRARQRLPVEMVPKEKREKREKRGQIYFSELFLGLP